MMRQPEERGPAVPPGRDCGHKGTSALLEVVAPVALAVQLVAIGIGVIISPESLRAFPAAYTVLPLSLALQCAVVGSLSQKHAMDPSAYERINYMHALESFTPPDSVRY